MMHKRGRQVDWPATERQVTRATRKCYPKKKFVPAKTVAEHINTNRDKYSEFRDISYSSLLQRTTGSMKRMNWRVWGSSCKRGTVFIPPLAEGWL